MDPWTASLYACILEAHTFKPGNIYAGRSGYADLLRSGFLLGNNIHEMCEETQQETYRGVGRYIHEAVIKRTQVVPTNTNLGIILLHIPLALAFQRGGTQVREALFEIVHSTTVEDAVEVMHAIRESGASVGQPEQGPDVRSENGVKIVQEEGYTLLQLFEISSSWDTIASEWVHGFPITFSGAQDLLCGGSVLTLYLNILAAHPDSLIRRKYGMECAEKVSCQAEKMLKNFSLVNIREWDHALFSQGINPGTTADLVSASICVALLKDDSVLERLIEQSREICET